MSEVVALPPFAKSAKDGAPSVQIVETRQCERYGTKPWAFVRRRYTDLVAVM